MQIIENQDEFRKNGIRRSRLHQFLAQAIMVLIVLIKGLKEIEITFLEIISQKTEIKVHNLFCPLYSLYPTKYKLKLNCIMNFVKETYRCLNFRSKWNNDGLKEIEITFLEGISQKNEINVHNVFCPLYSLNPTNYKLKLNCIMNVVNGHVLMFKLQKQMK